MTPKQPEESPDQETEDFAIFLTEELTKQHKQIQELQKTLSKEKDARQEERFFGILLLTILFNVLIFMPMQSWGGPISILILELIVLFLLARRMGMEEVEQIIDRFLSSLSGIIKEKD